MIINCIATGLGGAFGSITRLLLGKLLPSAIHGMPIPILFINILGCFIMGLLTEIMALHWTPNDHIRHFWISGFLGGFTTFSTFALECGLLFGTTDLICSWGSLYSKNGNYKVIHCNSQNEIDTHIKRIIRIRKARGYTLVHTNAA